MAGGRMAGTDGAPARVADEGPHPRARTGRLSEKERSVLRELAHGHSTEQIAGLLVVSPHTVRTHIKNGMRKLEARTRAHAVAIALSEGAIEFEPRPDA